MADHTTRIERARWLLVSSYAATGGWPARLRAFWVSLVRGHDGEICQRCGRNNMAHTGSWWHAPAGLWERVIGDLGAVVCPPCFTAVADAKGIRVHWQAAETPEEQ